MPTPRSSHTSPDPSGASCVANTGDLNKGKDTGRSSLEHCGLPSYDLNHRSSEGDQQKEPQTDKLTHGTRWEPIKVMLGNWEKEYSVIKPYADYTDVPSPIILPGSPPQRPPKPSLAGFYKVPTVRDPLENYLRSSRHMNIKEEPSPPAPPLQFPNRIASTSQDLRRRRPHRSNSDISVLDLGEPYQPLDTNYLAGDSNAAISLSLARGARPSALTTTSIYRAFPSPPPVTLQPSRGLRARRGLGSTALSVQVPANSNPSRSASGSPQSKGASATSSLGATFQLDEKLNVSTIHLWSRRV